MEKVLQRQDLKNEGNKAFWHALGAMHGSKGLAEEIPALPCSVTVTSDAEGELSAGMPQAGSRGQAGSAAAGAPAEGASSFTFHFSGAPCPMLPLLKEMVRYERPFITWDLWSEAPPEVFPSEPAVSGGGTPRPVAGVPQASRSMERVKPRNSEIRRGRTG